MERAYRTPNRRGPREFGIRVVRQMSTEDSANLYWEAHVRASLPMYRPAGSVKELGEEDRAYAKSRILTARGEPQSYRVHRLPR